MAHLIDEGQPGHRPLARGQAVQHVDQGGRQIGKEGVNVGLAGRDDKPLVAGTKGVDGLARQDEGWARTFRGWSLAADWVLVDLATHDHPAHVTPAWPEGGPEDGREWVGRRCQQPLELVALGEPERRESLIPIGRVQLCHQVSQT